MQEQSNTNLKSKEIKSDFTLMSTQPVFAHYVDELRETGGLKGTDIANIADVSEARYRVGPRELPARSLALSLCFPIFIMW